MALEAQRRRSRRPLIVFIVAIIVAIIGMAVFPLYFLYTSFVMSSHTPVAVDIYDEAGIVDATQLKKNISNIDFYVPVHVVILTLPTVEGNGLNDSVLAYARSHPETGMINSQDPRYWEDSYVILAVAPKARLVGTYYGENVKLDLPDQENIQRTMGNEFKQTRWDKGFEAGAQHNADLIHAPSTGSKFFAGGASVASLLGFSYYLSRGRRAQRAFAQARTHWANVTRDYDTTKLTAGTLPPKDPYASAVLTRFQAFEANYHTLAREFLDLGRLTTADFYSSSLQTRVKTLHERAEALDSTDDAISNTAEFLFLGHKWRDAFHNELGPIYEDIEALDTLCREAGQGVNAQILNDAYAFIAATMRRPQVMEEELAHGQLTPSQALAELDDITEKINTHARNVAYNGLKAKPHSEEGIEVLEQEWNIPTTTYSGQWRWQGSGGSYDPGATIRPHRGTLGYSPTGLGSSSSFSGSPVSGLVVGYSHASSAASASSDSFGSSSGFSSGGSFGGGGGGFSGSGSSSSF